MRERIQTLDGLRFLAAIGVLWIHSWTTFGNPRCYIGKIDIANLLAIGGNGVDLFFVISGFCMYFFYASKTRFSYYDFGRFIRKRWIRLSPAFYSATIVYILINKYCYHYNDSNIQNLFNSVFYLNSIFTQYNAASHFWTLGVEWQFYFTIPFLLIYQKKYGFNKIFITIFGSIFLVAAISVLVVKNQTDFLINQIFFRGIEFGAGIIAARLTLKHDLVLKSRAMWLLLSLIITYTGRIMISKPVFDLSAYYYNLFRLLGFSLMGFGFAGIVYLSVTSVKWLTILLGNKAFKTMGRISYSFYLWHGLIHPVVTKYITTHFPVTGIIAPIITTIVSTLILYPISMFSYQLLEKPFLSAGNLTTR